MKNVEQSQAFLRKRKVMLVLPMLVIPFLTLAFWVLGGGNGNAGETDIVNKRGLNLNLPDANLKTEELNDKLGFYNKAERDSLKMEEWMRNDPYYQSLKDSIQLMPSDLEQLTQKAAGKYNQQLNTSLYEYNNKNPEQQIIQKLALLQKQLDNPVADSNGALDEKQNTVSKGSGEDLRELENMMQQMTAANGNDPEINQLNHTLDKILDIQHPGRVKGKLQSEKSLIKETVYAVSKQKHGPNISLLDTNKKTAQIQQGFFGVENNSSNQEQNSIEAVIHENQTLVNGAVVKMRLTNDIYINGTIIHKGNFVFGIASLDDERLAVEITSIRNNQSIFPVKLEVFDMDGLPGIYIPGAITRDVAKQTADNSLQLMELSSLDPSFKAQAAAAGITAAKSLISRKVKQVKVMVKAGYKVLLKDKNIQQ
ncbi:MAG: conjugative transposon protein TraM [Sediminibacterium sp.]